MINKPTKSPIRIDLSLLFDHVGRRDTWSIYFWVNELPMKRQIDTAAGDYAEIDISAGLNSAITKFRADQRRETVLQIRLINVRVHLCVSRDQHREICERNFHSWSLCIARVIRFWWMDFWVDEDFTDMWKPAKIRGASINFTVLKEEPRYRISFF